ncbi:MAG: hypothetical protein OEZ23_08175 [Gammaproteobacteria bacterium]|nr:hypothetical protein [Gammaproteobacteria bacterium]
MSKVKGRKRYEMVVVPHRPVYKAMWLLGSVLLAAILVWIFYEMGLQQGTDLKESVLNENIKIKQELLKRDDEITRIKRQLADIELGGEIDAQTNVQVMNEIEALKTEIAELNEEIRFYKGVMLPKGEKGLRIESLDLKGTLEANRVEFTLLLTQVVDKHDYIRGKVEIKITGSMGDEVKELSLSEIMGNEKNAIGFNFRYFQTLKGEFLLPSGFVPQQMLVTASSTGRNRQTLERRFDWGLQG